MSNVDWQSGKYMWFIDYVAPYGHIAHIVHAMQQHVFPY
ncbi:hemolysin-activating ACP:hemolysin acyltransferase [Bartonella fuyuanensis]|uniref:RTX toxin-activating lysine-acyltransferase n=1 Tax=Bartonella fuyuanensis TaxID=1460968 RepID=A0A840DYW8_9HYPH|nr:toxin-activating lysine-acyltransferase [Bartonella fuyuanensis]MBB4076712.1 hemolysin-activating ACP:hemolysin acyltransferase [Bartonella fuyuanensis]